MMDLSLVSDLRPDSDYNRWLGQLILLRAAGFSLDEVDRWSRGGEKYVPGEVQARWHGLPDGEDPERAARILRAMAGGCRRGWSGSGPGSVRDPAPGSAAAPVPAGRELHADWALFGRLDRIDDLAAQPAWIPATWNKRPFTWSGGAPGFCLGFRQSAPEGMRLARFGGGPVLRRTAGGRSYRLQVLPWRSRSRIAEYGLASALCLGGDPDAPGLPVGAFDVDYHPDRDVSGLGRRYRAALLARFLAAGLPVFASSGGSGFHGVFRLRESSEIWAGRFRFEPGSLGGCLGVDRFLPGDRRLLVLRLDLPVHDGRFIPAIDLADLDRLLAV